MPWEFPTKLRFYISLELLIELNENYFLKSMYGYEWSTANQVSSPEAWYPKILLVLHG